MENTKIKPKILIVEDEEAIIHAIECALSDKFTVKGVTHPREALAKINKICPDLIILDLVLPEIDGLEICRILRRNKDTYSVPIIMLTARKETEDIIRGFEVGADDYLLKPFDVRELLVRIKAVMQRANKKGNFKGIMHEKDFIVDSVSHEVEVDGQEIYLTRTEFNLLCTLMKHRNKVLSKEYLYKKVWGNDELSRDSIALEMHLYRLRKKLKRKANIIESIPGIGYKFCSLR